MRLNNCKKNRSYSPQVVEYHRQEFPDANGESHVAYVKTDLNSVRVSNGTGDLWNLSTMLKSGVNPQTPIHTGNNTRLEGISQLNNFVETAENILTEKPNEE